ncbi:MAG: bifunctional riboflavin kinase/FAD synthetase [bacterium]|nr:bifunctional riboflavin kinase/FAD synthetase [bacterium]
MKYFVETTDFHLKNSVVTLGKFDGLHIGHQMLIDHVVELKKKGYQSVMFTFSLHPYNLFSKEETKLIYTNEEKLLKLREEGLDVLIAYPFTTKTASLEPEEFIKEVLVKQCDAKAIIVGNDFCFGKNRRGNVEMLKKYADEFGYEVHAYEKVEYEDGVVSATRIREEIEKGNMEDVENMLGRPFSVVGEVVHGRQLGRQLGMPTVNIMPSEGKLLPPNGVYASALEIDGKEYVGVTNVGYKPTVGDKNKLGIETYIIDFKGDLYGKILEVKLLHYMRPEQKFVSIEELKDQMHRDMENVLNKTGECY